MNPLQDPDASGSESSSQVLTPAPPPVLMLYLLAVLTMIITAWLSRRLSRRG